MNLIPFFAILHAPIPRIARQISYDWQSALPSWIDRPELRSRRLVYAQHSDNFYIIGCVWQNIDFNIVFRYTTFTNLPDCAVC